MDHIKIFRHQDYELHCSASATDGGKFVPSLVVTKQVWPTRPRTIAVSRGDHLNEATAIDAAYSEGVAWIATYGGR